jgi:N-methylhydantoinase B
MAAAMEILPGERVLSSTGGGGYGDPLSREPDAVCDDVREGWVARDRAREVYGVILTEGPGPEGDQFLVDPAATRAERGRRLLSAAPTA